MEKGTSAPAEEMNLTLHGQPTLLLEIMKGVVKAEKEEDTFFQVKT
ncbi:hypothetical protein Krac_0169 [Ktedonobacter racemifer DSM 44963]|uniref:Uncharacterized protein n=1 Tax=Ktedonobacter racemifer DSM 44963 TaxID=485913 RepID=D6U722_KTERA|nr:hypothetical protein Krac_0169 [Ktedonobacter racemifer DSM 44963]